jgi:hypothetical protein
VPVASPIVDDDLLTVLRGTPALRPAVDRGLAGGLRAWLEDGIFERLGTPAPGPVRLTSRTVAGTPSLASAASLLRGALIAQLVRLKVASAPVNDPFDDAACALSASGRNDDLVALLVDLDADEHARLAAEVEAHHAVLDALLPSIPSRWSPRCGVRQAVPLAGGGVELRGCVDVELGQPGTSRSCVCLIDVTTSVLEPRHDAVLSYLALLETLRSGESPLRVAALSTADGTFRVRDVSSELLSGAVELVLHALVAPPGT